MKKWGYWFIFGLPVLQGDALAHADSVLGWPAMLIPLGILIAFCVSPFVMPLRLLHADTDFILWLGLYALSLVWFLRKSRVGDLSERVPDAALPNVKKRVHRWSWWFGIIAAIIVYTVLSVTQYRVFGRANFWANGLADTLFNAGWQAALIAWFFEHVWRITLQSRLVADHPLDAS